MAIGSKGRPSGRRAPITISTAVALLLAALLIVVTVLTGYLVWHDREETLARSEERAVQSAQAAAEHIRWLMEANLQVLRRTDEALGPTGRPPSGIGSFEIYELEELLPQGAILRVFDRAGQPLLTTESEEPVEGIGDRPYFRALRAGAQTHVSPLIMRDSPGGERFTVSRRIERDGAFAGAAVVILPARIIAAFWASLDLGPDSVVGLFRRDGELVTRYPLPAAGVDLSDHPLFAEHLPGSEWGHYISEGSVVDGVPRIVGYRVVPGLALVTVTGISRATALSRFHNRMRILAVVGAPVFFGLAVVSVWGVRVLRREERTRAQLGVALERNRMLMREIHHRVKNNLQVVSTLVRMQPGASEAKAEMRQRIAAMTAMHEYIYESDSFDGIALSEYLPRLIDGLKDAYGSDVRVSYELDPAHAPNEVALPLALIVGEVVSNALKHAFPDGRTGKLAVSLRCRSDDTATLTIGDNGVGRGDRSESRGLGMRLIDGFSAQLGGSYSFENGSGTRFVFTFPLVGDGPAEPAPASA